jgi:hypothetical protein
LTQASSKLIQSGKNKNFLKKKNKKRPSQPEKPRKSMSNLQLGLLDRDKPRERKQKKMVSLISQQIQCRRIKLKKKSIKKNKKNINKPGKFVIPYDPDHKNKILWWKAN